MEKVAIEERRVAIAEMGVATRVLIAGSGPTVLMLHGNPDNADEWAPLMSRLSKRFRCIAPDFPGYGKSPEPPKSFSYSLAHQIQFVDAITKAIDVADRVILVVHDTGGMVGAAWAAANLDRLRAIVVTNTVAFDGFPWFPVARQWGDTSVFGRARSSIGMVALGLRQGALFKKIFRAQFPQLDAGQIERFTAKFAMNRGAKRTTLRQFRQFMQPGSFKDFQSMRERIAAAAPRRVVWGDQDKLILTKYAECFGSDRVTIIPNAGHWVALTAADELAAEVEAIAEGR